MAIIANMGTWLVIVKEKNSHKKNTVNNPGPKPGEAKICQERGETIAVLKTKQNGLEEDIHEIKEDIKEIKRAVVK